LSVHAPQDVLKKRQRRKIGIVILALIEITQNKLNDLLKNVTNT